MAGAPKYVEPYLQNLNPGEVHNVGGDCINPKCDYPFSERDHREMELTNGYFTCPKCDWSYNYYYDPDGPGGWTRSGLTMRQMGQVGENLVASLGHVPGVGDITWHSQDYNSPLDFIIGPYGIEVKTNHSEATPRFKLGGRYEVNQKKKMAEEMGLIAGFLGVRLNFQHDVADLFFRPQLSDTWIGNAQLQHVAKVNFHEFNPYRRPQDVPPGHLLPEDDSTPGAWDDDIPF